MIGHFFRMRLAARVYRPLQFHKCSQHFIGAYDETLSIAMCVNNPDRSPLAIHSFDPAQAKTDFMEIVSDDFLVRIIACLQRLYPVLVKRFWLPVSLS